MSARIFNFKAKSLYGLEKMTITTGQLEMVYQLIETGLCSTEDRRSARLFADIGDMLIKFCKPEGK